uniref:Uncharacterized protein n=1 Tax=Melanopsichium pennsylvanicum 4 TaxID=1398559 RepID=A0A077QST4_9BASI|nr:putative protein [Melanopsichium pennsylvanicum 4]
MTASTILHRATLTPPRMVVGRRLNSAASATPTPRSRPSKGQGMNQPKAIFWGWFGLVVVAGLGYFTVKSNNTAKKREFMVKQGQELQQKNAMLNEDGEPAATTTPVR